MFKWLCVLAIFIITFATLITMDEIRNRKYR